MKDQRITIPENTRVIIDGDIIIFEEKKEKPKFEIGWHKNKEFSNHILCRGLNDFCGFDKSGQWHDELFTPIIQRFEEADPKEVTRLLISEAEKRGAKKGCKVRFLGNNNIFKPVNEKFDIRENSLIDSSGFYFGGIELFNFNTGKWAEIIREPLYTNSYGTEFFEGDDCWAVSNFKGHKLAAKAEYYINNGSHAKSIAASELMTEREYHRYLDENWDELNKNK